MSNVQPPAPSYNQQGSFQGGYPQQPYPPQGGPPYQHQQPPMQAAPSAAQIGEDYRAGLYARCAQGIHQPTTKYGICGIITAVVCFPCGLICLFTDTEQKCAQCGIRLDK